MDFNSAIRVCQSQTPNLGVLTDVLVQNGQVFFTSVRESEVHFTKLDLSTCETKVFSKTIPNRKSFVGSSIHRPTENSSELLVLHSYEIPDAEILYTPAHNELNEKEECGFLFRTTLSAYSVEDSRMISTKSLNGLHHMERSSKHLSGQTESVYFRESTTCDGKVYFIEGKASELLTFVKDSQRTSRVPLSGSLSLRTESKGLEKVLNRDIFSWSSISKPSAKEKQSTTGVIIANRSSIKSRFLRSRAPDNHPRGELSIPDLRAESAFFMFDVNGLGQVIHSGVECDAFFSHATGNSTSAIGCITQNTTNPRNYKLIVIPHPANHGSHKGLVGYSTLN